MTGFRLGAGRGRRKVFFDIVPDLTVVSKDHRRRCCQCWEHSAGGSSHGFSLFSSSLRPALGPVYQAVTFLSEHPAGRWRRGIAALEEPFKTADVFMR